MSSVIMLDMKEEAIKLYEETHSYAATARKLKVTRQRIHQLVTGYRSGMFSGKNKMKMYSKIYWLNKPLLCLNCLATPFVDFHHKDNDINNNSLENLLPVCKSCHYSFHTKSDSDSYPLIATT